MPRYDFPLPPSARILLDRLEEAGFEAFVVGGCVRDFLRGVPPHDYDMTTNATPPDMQRVFADYRLIETGIRHGTVTVLSDGIPYEITTYRVDGAYTDNRHPAAVSFSANLQEDAARRDFTINAMAYHPVLGLRDYFGGEADIRDCLIRAVGDPGRRFDEDALRILRALRFASTLGFSLEEETAAAAREKAPNLVGISAERVRDEWQKLLLGSHVSSVLPAFHDILAPVLPAWYAAIQQMPTSAEQTVKAIGAWLGKAPRDIVARATAFFSPLPHAEAVEIQMAALRFDRRTQNRVVKLYAHQNDPCTADISVARRFLSGLGAEDARLLLSLRLARKEAEGQNGEAEKAAIAAIETLIRQEGACTSVRDLALRGKDLLPLGFAPGKEMGLALSALLSAVIDGKVQNQKEALLAYAAAYRKKG